MREERILIYLFLTVLFRKNRIMEVKSQVCVCAASTNLKARLALRNKAAQKWSKK